MFPKSELSVHVYVATKDKDSKANNAKIFTEKRKTYRRFRLCKDVISEIYNIKLIHIAYLTHSSPPSALDNCDAFVVTMES